MNLHENFNSKLYHARPRLKLVAPLTYRICQGFAGVNFLIAIYLLFISTAFKSTPLVIAQGFLGFGAWGLVYLVLAAVFGYATYKNDWRLLRIALRVGLVTKFMWTAALVLLVLGGHQVFGIMILWLFLTWTQAWTIVHFLPVVNWDGFGGDSDDKR